MVYDLPFFKHSNWWMKNVVGNWELAPIYTYQTGTLVTPQSVGTDANLNGDPAGDRTMINPSGIPGTGSPVTPLCSGPTAPSCPADNPDAVTVGYLVNDPKAQYISGAAGVHVNGGRNTAHLPPMDDIDVTALKRINITERYSVEFSARIFNVLNHPQPVGGWINDVQPFINAVGPIVNNYTNPASSNFLKADQAFSSNPRTIQLALKLVF
jgi:hypothetical protein